MDDPFERDIRETGLVFRVSSSVVHGAGNGRRLSTRREGRPNEALCDVAWHAIRAFDAAGPLISRSCIRASTVLCGARAMKRASPIDPAAPHESACGPSRQIAAPRNLGCERGVAEVDGQPLLQNTTLETRSRGPGWSGLPIHSRVPHRASPLLGPRRAFQCDMITQQGGRPMIVLVAPPQTHSLNR